MKYILTSLNDFAVLRDSDLDQCLEEFKQAIRKLKEIEVKEGERHVITRFEWEPEGEDIDVTLERPSVDDLKKRLDVLKSYYTPTAWDDLYR